jgi:hypothetical protein
MCYNVETQIWKKCFSMDSPMARSQHATCKITETDIVLFGGFSESKDTLLNDVWVCDLSALDPNGKGNELTGMVWLRTKIKGTAPSPRKGHSFVKIPHSN